MQAMDKENEKMLHAKQRRYERLARTLTKSGLVLQGTITERTIVRDNPDAPGKQKTYGPYYQWTFKQAGKTVTVNLSAAQAKTHNRAIANHRKLQETLEEMRALAREILELKTTGVRRRKVKEDSNQGKS